jgi:hypothetical protein
MTLSCETRWQMPLQLQRLVPVLLTIFAHSFFKLSCYWGLNKGDKLVGRTFKRGISTCLLEEVQLAPAMDSIILLVDSYHSPSPHKDSISNRHPPQNKKDHKQ